MIKAEIVERIDLHMGASFPGEPTNEVFFWFPFSIHPKKGSRTS